MKLTALLLLSLAACGPLYARPISQAEQSAKIDCEVKAGQAGVRGSWLAYGDFMDRCMSSQGFSQ